MSNNFALKEYFFVEFFLMKVLEKLYLNILKSKISKIRLF